MNLETFPVEMERFVHAKKWQIIKMLFLQLPDNSLVATGSRTGGKGYGGGVVSFSFLRALVFPDRPMWQASTFFTVSFNLGLEITFRQ